MTNFISEHRVAIAAAIGFVGAWKLASAIADQMSVFALVAVAAYTALAAVVAYRYGQRRAAPDGGRPAQRGSVERRLRDENDQLRQQLEDEREVVRALTESLTPDQAIE